MDNLSAQRQIYTRSQRMSNVMLLHENEKICFIANLSMNTSGLIGSNLRFLQQLVPNVEIDNADRLHMLRELTQCRENELAIHGLTKTDIDEFINFISTF